MKWVYGLLVEKELSAFHKDKSVVKEYAGNYKRSHPDDHLTIVKIKKEKAKSLPYYFDYYLVECCGLIVQAAYQDVLYMNLQDDTSTKQLDSQLTKLLLCDLTKSEREAVKEVIKINKQREFDNYSYTPTLNELIELYWRYEEFKNHTYY